ncbi:MAG: phospholipase D-like domain-containing protein [Thermoplasmata archaeon]
MWIGAVLLGLLALTPGALGSQAAADGFGLVVPERDHSSSHDEGERLLSPLLLVEVLAHAPRDNEYVVIANPGSRAVNLSAWTLTDGEGSWTFPDDSLVPGRTILLTRNATALWEDAGLTAGGCLEGCNQPLTARGTLALRNRGDELGLLDPMGRLVDAYAYGDVSPGNGWVGEAAPDPSRGHLARRRSAEDGWLDTDTATDWAWDRPFRLGQSRHPAVSFEDVAVMPLLSPNDSLEGLLAILRTAADRIDLAGFTLTNPSVVEALQEALRRGVHVHVGVEGSPPGGIGMEGERILEELGAAGAQVRLMGSHGEGSWRRYALHHAKYLLVDEAWLVVGSENFSPNGYPTGAGNRGWGVAVRDPTLAGWFRAVMREDWDVNRSDVRSLPGATRPGGGTAPLQSASPFAPSLPRAAVTAFLGPDRAAGEEGLLRVLASARAGIDVELFYLRWWWGERLNPLVAALLRAAERGVAVRLLLDGQPYNVGGEEDNDEAVRRLNRMAEEAGLPLEARILPGDPHGVVKLHNKGLLVDGGRAWISSMNWNVPGAYANREAALLVESREVAGVFAEAFEGDWRAGKRPGDALPPGASLGDGLLWISLGSGGAAAVWWWLLRTTKQPTNKHPRKAKRWRRRSKRPSSPSRPRRSRSTRTVR